MELLLDGQMTPTGVRVSLVIVAGLVCYLTPLGLSGLAPEERRLVAGLGVRLRTWSAKRGGQRFNMSPDELLGRPFRRAVVRPRACCRDRRGR